MDTRGMLICIKLRSIDTKFKYFLKDLLILNFYRPDQYLYDSMSNGCRIGTFILNSPLMNFKVFFTMTLFFILSYLKKKKQIKKTKKKKKKQKKKKKEKKKERKKERKKRKEKKKKEKKRKKKKRKKKKRKEKKRKEKK